MGVVFFSFVPTLLEGAIGDRRWAWQVAALALAAYQSLLMATYFRSLGRAHIGQVTLGEWALVPGGVAIILLLFVSGAGGLPQHLEVVYLFAQVWLLGVAAVDFLLLLLRGEREG